MMLTTKISLNSFFRVKPSKKVDGKHFLSRETHRLVFLALWFSGGAYYWKQAFTMETILHVCFRPEKGALSLIFKITILLMLGKIAIPCKIQIWVVRVGVSPGGGFPHHGTTPFVDKQRHWNSVEIPISCMLREQKGVELPLNYHSCNISSSTRRTTGGKGVIAVWFSLDSHKL